MPQSPIVISLPTADRPTSYAFYGDGLGFDAVGEVADDGVPEPLRFVLNDGVHLMLIPTGGFGWVIGNHEVAAPGQSECAFSLNADTEAEVDELVERARRSGGEVVAPPGKQPWGYSGAFADPDGHVWLVTVGPFPPSS
ncbi:VOC family protein [Streptomyces sp. NA04227]|uniref:VOC family protein n=1 Tax=Streptomyces sp. NA04227 TaxID=2742136 RepID=UPI0015927089|nr:VOC family protein [Streptomyces sp. NA04227]QKW05079.1 VOC family protein [Streptomyces sp. NA04227]